MRRPLLGVALGFIGGILIEEYCAVPLSWQWGLVAAAVVCSVPSLILPSPAAIRTLSVLLLVTASGIVDHGFAGRPPSADDIRLAANEGPSIAKLRGTIDTPPEAYLREPRLSVSAQTPEPEVSTKFDLRVSAMRVEDGWRPRRGTVLVTIYEDAPDLRYGDEIEVSGSIRRPPPPTNPGQFDYKTVLARRGVFVLLGADFADNVHVISGGHGSWVMRRVFGIRQAADSFIKRNTTPEVRGVLLCMLLGRRKAVPKDLEEEFIRSGTVHVLSVSGLHVMMLAGTLWWALCTTALDRRINAALVLAFVVFYVMMTGMQAPVLRAGIITGLMCLGEILERDRDTINSLAAAAIAILVAAPYQLFSPGFQLSFVSIIGIVCFEAPIERLLFGTASLAERLTSIEQRGLLRDMTRKYFRINISASIAAILTTAPLVAWCFHVFTPFAVVFNLFVFPFVWAIVSWGTTVIVLGMALGEIVWPLVQVLNLLVWVFQWLVRLSGSLYFAYMYIPAPSLAWTVCYYLVLVAAACRHFLSLRRVHVEALMGALLVVPLYLHLLAPAKPGLRVTCLDVGHGAAFVLEFPNGRNLLYDAGTWSRYDAGESTIAPFLWSRGIRKVDTLVLSHAHVDHYSAVPSLRARFAIDRVLIHSEFTSTPITSEIIERLKWWGAEVIPISADDRITGYGDCVIDVLHPPRGDMIKRLSPNDGSCVLRAGWRGFSLLLTGDIEEDGVRILLRNFPDVHADVMQIPHHGGPSPAVERLLKIVSPGTALINAGHGQAARNPPWDMDRRIHVYSTPRNGAITLTVDSEGKVDVETFLPEVSSRQ